MNIGVYGSAAGDPHAEELAREVGIAIAKAGHTVVTGACNGVPQAAVLGALGEGVESIGFSSYISLSLHEKDGDPVEGFGQWHFIPEDFPHIDNVLVTHKYRNVTSVAFVDASIFINGRIGTLNEFTNAHDFNKPIGLLKGSGGVTDDVIPYVLEKVRKHRTAPIIVEQDPVLLVKKMSESYAD